MGKLLMFPVLPKEECCQVCGVVMPLPDNWDYSHEVVCLPCYLWSITALAANLMKELT